MKNRMVLVVIKLDGVFKEKMDGLVSVKAVPYDLQLSDHPFVSGVWFTVGRCHSRFDSYLQMKKVGRRTMAFVLDVNDRSEASIKGKVKEASLLASGFMMTSFGNFSTFLSSNTTWLDKLPAILEASITPKLNEALKVYDD